LLAQGFKESNLAELSGGEAYLSKNLHIEILRAHHKQQKKSISANQQLIFY
jgi:dihydrodipicolinate reductase